MRNFVPVLASKSPRRKEILSIIFGDDFKIVVTDADESSDIRDPALLVEELSARKAEAAYDKLKKEMGGKAGDLLVIGSDTVVYAGSEILGKPRDEDDAKRMIKLLAGKEHSVFSGITLICGGKKVTSHEETRVFFGEMSDGEIDEYVNSGECFDKAGGYAIQGKAARYIDKIEGDYFNVVGLPLRKTVKLAKEIFGITL